MLNKEINNMHIWFKNYINEYYYNYPEHQLAIKLKEEHTLRVCENIKQICSSLSLDNNDSEIANIIALFHDIGRFQQYCQYGTFNDRKSENHALLGLKILAKHNVLTSLNSNDVHLITQAISLHNVWKLPFTISKDANKFTCLIRDADKLDILNIFAINYTHKNYDYQQILKSNLPDDKNISPAIMKCFLSNQTCSYDHVKNHNDRKMLQLSWIYDINYPYTFNEIINKKYIETILDTMPFNHELTKIQNHLNKYIENILSNNVNN